MSIRQIIRTGLLSGLNTAEIGTLIRAEHPTSAAAAKVSKHVAFYRAEMVKAGEIAPRTGAMVGRTTTKTVHAGWALLKA